MITFISQHRITFVRVWKVSYRVSEHTRMLFVTVHETWGFFAGKNEQWYALKATVDESWLKVL